MSTNALLAALRRGNQSGTIGSAAVVLNLTALALDACSWFMTVEADANTTVAVELSFDGAATWYPASPAQVVGTGSSQYEEYVYSRSPGEAYPNRVRLRRSAGTSVASTYGIGPMVAQAVVAQGWYRQVVVNAPGRVLMPEDIGAALTFFGQSNSAIRIPADGSALIGGRSWRQVGQTKYPAFAALRVGDGRVDIVGETDSGNNPLVTVLGLDRVTPNDKLLTAVLNIAPNVWVVT